MNPPKAPRTRFTAALAVAAALALAVPAAAQVSRNMTLLATMNIHPTLVNSLAYQASWPYIHSDGREYVVLMTEEGASIVRLTDPAHPVEVGFFGSKTPWTECRQYGHYVYMTTDNTPKVTDAPNNAGLAILDMSNPDQPHKVANLQSPIVNAHSLEIDQQRGILYLNGEFLCSDPDCAGTILESMKIFSLADPEKPALLAVYPTYVHHIHLRGTIGYASLLFEGTTDGFCAVLDLSDPSNPREITRIVTDRTSQHSGWTTEDGRWLYLDNEVTGDGLTVWDVSNVASPRQVFTFEDLPRHMFHKSRVLGNRLYLAYYSAGVRVMDIRDPSWPVEFAYYDTDPNVGDEGIFFGAYDVAPFYPSGIVTVSDDKTGLYVFRVDPVNYGIIRGTVREGPNGPTVAGATVTVQPANMTVKSGRDGRYAFAVPVGAATVTVSNFAFQTTVRSVSVALNSDQTVNIGLVRQDAGTLSGTVRATSGGSILPRAEAVILGTPLRATANAQGVYTFPSVPEGTYTVRTANPGNAAQSVTLNIPKNKTTKQDFSLGDVAFYDDAETDRGWTIGDPSDVVFFNIGVWERATPSGKVFCDDGSLIEPAEDHTPGPGNTCFTTQTFVVPCFAPAGAVVGLVSVVSPVLHLAGIPDPRIGYWRWYQTTKPGYPTLAPFLAMLSSDGGATWITVDNSLTTKSAWEYAEIRVRDFISNPGDVRVRFAVDNRAFEFIRPEAAVDDIAVYAGNGGGSMAAPALAASPAFAVGAPRPSPTRGSAEVELTLPRSLHVRADIYDIQGRLVQTAVDGNLPAGSSVVRWNGKTTGGVSVASGIYWMAIRAGQEERKLKIVVVR